MAFGNAGCDVGNCPVDWGTDCQNNPWAGEEIFGKGECGSRGNTVY